MLKGGCSDDGFEYFRGWLLSRGRKVYEAAMRNPDSLVRQADDSRDNYELESMLYVASYGEPQPGSRMGEGASTYDAGSLAQMSYVETGNARNIVVSMGHAFVTNFDGSLTLLSLDTEGNFTGDSFTIPSGGELTKELAVVPVDP